MTDLPDHWLAIHPDTVAAAEPAQRIAILPLAATEQHGPHLPFTTDVLIAEAYLAEVRARLAPDIAAVLLPIERIGISTEHIDYPGTLTLDPVEAIRGWTALGAQAARHGIRKLVMVSSHGGNSGAMAIVAQELRARLGMLAVTTSWSRFGLPEGLFADEEIRHGIHGGAVETSIMLARFPGEVKHERIADFRPSSLDLAASYRWLSTQRPAPFAWQTQDLHPSGAVGDATQATAEKGERLLTHGARAFCELLADVARFDLAQFRLPPSADNV